MWHPIARPPNEISKCSYLMRFFVGIGIIIPFIIPQWSVGGGGWWSMLVLDPQATLLFQTTDFTLHSSARMSLQRLELKRRPKLKSRIELMANGTSWISSLYSWYSSQGSTWIIAPKSHPNKNPAFSVLVVSFWGIYKQHFMAWKAYVLWPRQRNAQFWDPSLERAFALLQLTMEVGVGAMGWSMIFTIPCFSSHTLAWWK